MGGENGAARVLGGLSSAAPKTNWYCDHRAVGHFTMKCQHGHKGQVMALCNKHYMMYRNSVDFCPRCNATPPGHKCRLVMEHIS